MMKTKYDRKSTTITISIFYEQYMLKKYRFDPPYQRDNNVWDPKQKAFLIDTIMKNYPMPPIYLEQKINKSKGITNYDVIDGKQRLNTIIEFIENKIEIPQYFSKDMYGNELLNGKKMNEIIKLAEDEDNEIAQDYLSNFWSYLISVEYVENPNEMVVENIFDRMNRGGERLNSFELRKAKYYDTLQYQNIDKLRGNGFVKECLKTLNKARLEDVGFLTEIYLMVFKGEVLEGKEEKIDKYFEDMVDKQTEEDVDQIINFINQMINVLEEFDLDYEKYSIQGVSHLYAVWYLVYVICKKNIKDINKMKRMLIDFYEDLRGNQQNGFVKLYHSSMQSASKSKSSRNKRVGALLNYLGISEQ